MAAPLPRWWLVIVVGIAMVAGCGSSDRRGSEVRAMIDSVWDAVGVDEEVVHVANYRDTTVPTRTRCAHLDRDDRWYGEQASSIPPGQVTQASAEEAIGTLSEDGATTVHLRSGPCAPFMGGFDPSVYEVDDGS